MQRLIIADSALARIRRQDLMHCHRLNPRTSHPGRFVIICTRVSGLWSYRRDPRRSRSTSGAGFPPTSRHAVMAAVVWSVGFAGSGGEEDGDCGVDGLLLSQQRARWWLFDEFEGEAAGRQGVEVGRQGAMVVPGSADSVRVS